MFSNTVMIQWNPRSSHFRPIPHRESSSNALMSKNRVGIPAEILQIPNLTKATKKKADHHSNCRSSSSKTITIFPLSACTTIRRHLSLSHRSTSFSHDTQPPPLIWNRPSPAMCWSLPCPSNLLEWYLPCVVNSSISHQHPAVWGWCRALLSRSKPPTLKSLSEGEMINNFPHCHVSLVGSFI